MSTTPDQNLASALAYVRGLERKDLQEIARHLHPEVHYRAPIATLDGKAQVVEAAKRFSASLDGITIRSRFAAGDQVMLAYELAFAGPIGVQHAAQLMTFRDGLIAEVRAYFDPRPFAPVAITAG